MCKPPPPPPPPRGGYSHIWTIRGCATQQGMVFASLGLEQGLKISVSVWNRVYFSPFRLWNTVGTTILLPKSRWKRTLLLFLLGSRCTFTQTRRFWLEGQVRLTFFSLEQGIYFQDFVWDRVAKLRLFSLEQGQVLGHSAAHPHPKFNDQATWGIIYVPVCVNIILLQLQSWSKVYGTPWKFAVFIIAPCSKAALFPKLGPPPPHIQCCFKGDNLSTLIQHCMGGGGMVKLSKKAKCTMTFDQDYSFVVVV